MSGEHPRHERRPAREADRSPCDPSGAVQRPPSLTSAHGMCRSGRSDRLRSESPDTIGSATQDPRDQPVLDLSSDLFMDTGSSAW